MVLPLLVLLLFAIAQFGVAFSDYLQVTDAARAAARQASTTAGNPCTTVSSFLSSNYAGLNATVDAASSTCTPDASGKWTVVVKSPRSINLLAHTWSFDLRTTVTERKEQ